MQLLPEATNGIPGLLASLAAKPMLPAIPEMEKMMLALPQAEAPVVHLFSPGLCVRQVTLPAGNVAIGHLQKYEHLNIMLEGSVTMDDGQTLTAPLVFVGKPGRKRGYVHEKVTWLNVYPTDLTSGDEVEAHFVQKSEAFTEHEQAARMNADRSADHADFLKMLEDLGVTAEQVKDQSENPYDQTRMPLGFYKFQLAESPIHGKGVFACSGYEAGELIGEANIGGSRTPLGRYTNHSASPNAKMVYANGGIYLYADKDIHGQMGGMLGDEITVDYRQARMEAMKCLA